MSEQTNTTIPDLSKAKELIARKLAEAGFTAFEEFTAADSLMHRDEQIAFYSLKEFTSNASCLHHENGSIFTQVDCVFEIKLMGTSSDYSDYLSFDDSCRELYASFMRGGEFILRSAELGSVFQSAPLKRLARVLRTTLRLCVKEYFEPEHESPNFHRAVFDDDSVIYPHSLDISTKARKVTINTVDGKQITKPIAPGLSKLTLKGRFAPDERDCFFKMAEELNASQHIELQIGGVTCMDVLPCECRAQVKDGELLGEYEFVLEGRAYEL